MPPVIATAAFYASVIGAEIGLTTLAGTALAASAAVSTATAGYSAYAQHKAAGAQASAQQRRFEAQQRVSAIKEQRSRVAQVAEERRRRAMNIQKATTAGAGGAGSSGVAGATASLGSQLASNVSFQQQIGMEQTNMANAELDIFKSQVSNTKKQAWAGVAKDVSGTIFKDLGGYRSIFSA